MFLHLSVILFTGRWCTPLWSHPSRHPLETYTPWTHTHPWPPSPVRSTNGLYASYWNAFLFLDAFRMKELMFNKCIWHRIAWTLHHFWFFIWFYLVFSGRWSWFCDFESPYFNTAFNWCGLAQESSGLDVFDWTITDRSTPSQYTGPDQAHAGRNYIYMEASYPRKLYDNAM